jgi:hypothetical protein
MNAFYADENKLTDLDDQGNRAVTLPYRATHYQRRGERKASLYGQMQAGPGFISETWLGSLHGAIRHDWVLLRLKTDIKIASNQIISFSYADEDVDYFERSQEAHYVKLRKHCRVFTGGHHHGARFTLTGAITTDGCVRMNEGLKWGMWDNIMQATNFRHEVLAPLTFFAGEVLALEPNGEPCECNEEPRRVD